MKKEELQLAANSAKRDLMRLVGLMEQISPKKARQLDAIVARLEQWQTTK